MREKGQTEVAKTLETPVFSRGIEILTEKFKFFCSDARDTQLSPFIKRADHQGPLIWNVLIYYYSASS